MPALVRSVGRSAAVALVAAALMSPAAPAQATNIERVVTPGGIEVWLVRDAAVPLIAVDFAFRGGANQDPPDKPGIANLAIDLLDEGAGDLDSSAFKDRLERKAIDLRSTRAATCSRYAAHAQGRTRTRR
jgi:zinc protease